VGKREQLALAQVPLFTPLSPRYLRRVADQMDEARYMEGARIVKEGEMGDTFYVIVEGQAKVENAKGRVVNRLMPGGFFGEISLLDGGARTATVVAETPMTLLALTRTKFLKLLQAEPAVAVKLLEYAAAMLRRLERPISG
jgi:CRP-like cAMP-binding protein